MKLPSNAVKLLWFSFIILSAAITLQNFLIIVSLPGVPITGSASSGEVSLCLNNPPYWINPLTCSDAYTLVPYSCNLSVDLVDPEGHNILNYSVTQLSGNPNGTNLFGSINFSTGLMNLTAQIDQYGNYTLRVTATDDHICPVMGSTIINFTVVRSTGAPILLAPIPDSTWAAGTTLVPYDLDDYYLDPEGFPLAFSVTGNSQIGISFMNGEVTLSPVGGFCGVEVVRYTATDVDNYSTPSNQVRLNVTCEDEDDQGQDEDSSGEGGGGGGGGAGFPRRCVESYYCYDWSSCQFTKAVTATGDELTLNITGVRGSRIFLVDEGYPADIDVFYQGFKWRECIDQNRCDWSYTKTYVKLCEYKPSCDDGIQNQNEEGIDCGGVCAPCGSCDDGIQNQGEEGIDCGGPCEPCYSCTDGIINGKELGVDCGGPDCPPCPTCFDGLKNQGEEGVDCGGPCPPCAESERPGLIGSSGILTVILLSLLLLLLLLILIFLIFRKFIKSLLAKLAYKHKRKNRVIILSLDAKKRILKALQSIEARLGREPIIKLQEELSSVVRSYFKEAFGLQFEFTYEELVNVLYEQKVHTLLQTILKEFFSRSSELEFSGVEVSITALQSLMSEVREIVYQTAVTTVDDLKARDEDLQLRTIPDTVPLRDKMYLLLSNGQIALQFSNYVVARRIYIHLNDLYIQAKPALQHAFHKDFDRFYNELQLVSERESGFLSRFGKS